VHLISQAEAQGPPGLQVQKGRNAIPLRPPRRVGPTAIARLAVDRQVWETLMGSLPRLHAQRASGAVLLGERGCSDGLEVWPEAAEGWCTLPLWRGLRAGQARGWGPAGRCLQQPLGWTPVTRRRRFAEGFIGGIMRTAGGLLVCGITWPGCRCPRF